MFRTSSSGCLFMCMLAVCLLDINTQQLRAMTEDEVCRALRERGVQFNTNSVQQAIVNSILKTADPYAKIVQPGALPEPAKCGTIKAELRSEGISYIKLAGLYEGGAIEVENCVRTSQLAGMSGLIIDIRGAEGHDMAATDTIAGMFVPADTVLYRIRDGRGKILETRRVLRTSMLPPPLPMILLVDERTGSASEFLALALRGRRGVMLVGRPTKGDAGLRELVPVSNTEELYIATRWIVPHDGMEYGPAGIVPDVVVSTPTSEDVAEQNPETRRRPGKTQLPDESSAQSTLRQCSANDAVLRRAVDILRGLKALGIAGPRARSPAVVVK